MQVKLLRHAVTEQFPECTLVVDARVNQQVLYLDYHLMGCMVDILLPSAICADPAQQDGLWEHTCFEVFLGVAGQTPYCEFNFSPSGDWAAYAFQAYRERIDWINPLKPVSTSVENSSSLHLSTCIPLGQLPEELLGQSLLIGLSAVVESSGHSKSWWAIDHAKSAPDFHLQHRWISLESLSSKP